MRLWIADPRVAVSALVVGCGPPPVEVTSEVGEGSSGAPPTSTAGSADDTATSQGTAHSSETGASGTASNGSEDAGSTGEPPDPDAPLGPFDDPVPVTALNSPYSDDDPTLTGDGLEIYFASNRDLVSEDVWMSTRDTVDGMWDVPVPVATVNSVFIETFPEVSADGLLMLVASNRADGADLDIYYSQRGARGQPWPAPLSVAGAASTAQDYGATPSPDMQSVFLCRDDLPGLGQADIWEAPADLVAFVVQTPQHVTALASPESDCSVTLSPSRREIFFESTRPIVAGVDWNLWTATREDPDGPWDDPVPVEELDTAFDDIDPWLSPDRRTLWFARGSAGAYDLYVATRG
jgi:hypothetical protein